MTERENGIRGISRILTVFILTLAVLLCTAFTGFTSSASAADTGWDGTTDTSWYNDTNKLLSISTTEQLAGLTENINGGLSIHDDQTSTVETPKDTIDVYMTVSMAGNLCFGTDSSKTLMAQVDIKVPTDESKTVTMDAALAALHQQYYPDGYALDGDRISKLFGQSDPNICIYSYENYKVTKTYQAPQNVIIGDKTYLDISINGLQNESYAGFAIRNNGQTKNFTFYCGIFDDSGTGIPNMQIGTLSEDGEFTPLLDKVTNLNGFVTLSFPETGTYILAARPVDDTKLTTIPAVGIITVQDEPQLTSLTFAQDVNGEQLLTTDPLEFNPDINDYTITVKDTFQDKNENDAAYKGHDKIYVKADLNGFGSLYSLIVSRWGYGWQGQAFDSKTATAGQYTDIGFDKNTGTVRVSDGDLAKTYTIHIRHQASLKNLSINESLTPSFDPDVHDYSAYVPETGNATIGAEGHDSSYNITYNGLTNNTVTPVWDENGEMKVSISVNGDTSTDSTVYNLTLKKEPHESKPVFVTNPIAGYKVFDTEENPEKLISHATASDTVTYQWFSSEIPDTSSGTAIQEATEANYTPVIPDIGTLQEKHLYYYCKATNTSSGDTAFSTITDITVKPDPNPITVSYVMADGSAVPEDGFHLKVGDTAPVIKAIINSDAQGGTSEYNWNGPIASTDQFYTIDTSRIFSGKVYCYYVTYSYEGKTVSHFFQKGEPRINVTISADAAAKPSVRTQPQSIQYQLDSVPEDASLSCEADSPDGGTISYQWYSSTDGINYLPIEGGTSQVYYIPKVDTEQTIYYLCKLKNTVINPDGQQFISEEVSTDSAVITYKAKETGKWTGDGTEESPFLISSLPELKELQHLVNDQGNNYKNNYFKMTADITLPDDFVPIGTESNVFSGHFDGGNHLLTMAKGGSPLFGTVSYVTVSNLNLYGQELRYTALVENYPDPQHIYDGSEHRLIEIDNVTLKSGSSTRKSGFVTGNGSGMSTVYIKNSTIESGVTIGYTKDQAYVGGFISCLNGELTNCISNADVYGEEVVGGLVGTKGQSMGLCNMYDCSFGGTVTATGNYVGGIIGSGYIAGSAPNTPCVSIWNCINTGTITGGNSVGGILGGEGGIFQCWANGTGYIHHNLSTGKVTATNGDKAGGIIGNMNALDRYNVITENYYLEDSANKGIGYIGPVDTTSVQFGRSDDPTGADADKLTKAVSSSALTDGTVVTLLNNGVTGTANWTQGSALPQINSKKHIVKVSFSGRRTLSYGEDYPGATAVATYSDGTTENVDSSLVSVSGYNKNQSGWQTITCTYNGFVSCIEVQTSKPVTGQKLKVTFSLLGDSKHDSDTDNEQHTLSGGNLTTWIEPATYEMDENTKVIDLFAKALSDAGYSWQNDNVTDGTKGNYIQSITTPDSLTIGEFTNGRNSGWMYTLNGTHPLLGVAQQDLSDGDVIVFHYSDNYTKEEGSMDTVAVSGVSLDKNSLELKTNESGKLTATIAPEDATEKGVTWSSDKNDIATVDEQGNVNAVSEGTAVITVTTKDGNKTASCTVTVKPDDQTLASAVIAKISALPQLADLTNNEADVKAVQGVRSMFDALTDAQKALVTNANVLEAAENKLADMSAADLVAKKIEALGTVTSLDQKKDVEKARAAFDLLTDTQKAYLSDAEKKILTDAEEAVKQLVQAVDDQKVAQTVMQQITDLGEITSIDQEEDILAARGAFNKLTDSQKAYVSNEAALTAAETKLADLKAVKPVQDLITALPSTEKLTLQDKASVAAAQDAFDKLSDTQKALVGNVRILTDAQAMIKQLEDQAAADVQAAEIVRAQIAALPSADKLTLNDKEAVTAAQDAFDKLSDTQKALVTNSDMLSAAQTAISRLEEQMADKQAAETVQAQIVALPSADKLTLNDRDAVEAARKACDKLSDTQKALISDEAMTALKTAETRIAELKEEAKKPSTGGDSGNTGTTSGVTGTTAGNNVAASTGSGTTVSGNGSSANTGVYGDSTAQTAAVVLVLSVVTGIMTMNRKRKED